MANNSKTFAQYTPCTSPAATDILVITSNVSGNAVTMQLAVDNLLQNTAVDLNTETLTANVVNTGILQVSVNATPANSADLPAAVLLNSIWSDGDYIYYYNGTDIKRAALTTF